MDSLLYFREYLSEKLRKPAPEPDNSALISKYRTKLNELMAQLEERYADKPASSLAEIISENKDLQLKDIGKWTKLLYGKTAREYLYEEHIITKVKKKDYSISDDEAVAYITKIDFFLIKKYRHIAVNTLQQIKDENKNIDFRYYGELTKWQYDETAKEHLIRIGMISKPVVYNGRSNLDKVIDILNSLISKYSNNPAHSMNQIVRENPGFSLYEFNRLSESVYGISGKELLIKWGVIDPCQKGDSVKKIAGKTTQKTYPVKAPTKEEDSQSEQINRTDQELSEFPQPVLFNNSLEDVPELKTGVVCDKKQDKPLSFREWLHRCYSGNISLVESYLEKVDAKLSGTSFAAGSILNIDRYSELKPYLTVIEQIVFDINGYNEARDAASQYSIYLLKRKNNIY